MFVKIGMWHWYIVIKYTPEISLGFPWPRSGHNIAFSSHFCSTFSGLQVSQSFLVCHDLDILERDWPRIQTNWFVWCFSHDETEIMGFGMTFIEVKSPSCHFYQKVCDIPETFPVMGIFITWLSKCLPGISTAESLFIPFLFYCSEISHYV